MVPSPVGKENTPPVAPPNNSEKDSKVQNNASLAIIQKQDHILNFQKWWSEGGGNKVAASHPLLHIVAPDVLAEVISAGAAYHTCLGIEKLDALLNKLEEAAGDTALDPLRKAMQTKGGARNQARAVGALLFSTARLVYEDGQGGHSVNLSFGKALFVGDKVCKTQTNSDESGRFDHSAPDSFGSPPLLPRERVDSNSPKHLGTTAAVPANAPSFEQLPIADAEQEQYEGKVGKDAEAAAVASTEEAILEQQDQIQRFQSWWAEGKGKEAAGLHPMLSLLDAAVLADIIAAGANYHNCLSADRLDALQRHISKSNGPGLEALQRALQAKGGAKSQARAVGSVIFKEAMDMFKNPPAEMNKSSLATSSESSQLEQSGGKVEQPKLNAGVVADEIFEPPKRFICSESFPPEATVAVRAAPSHQSEYLTCLPHGTEIYSTGRFGDFLRFRLPKDGAEAYVPFMFRGLTVFVPGSLPSRGNVSPSGPSGSEAERLAQLEDRVSHQETVIKALQAELSALRAHMSAVATAFGTLASRSS